MKVGYWDYLKTLDVSVLVAEIIFSELRLKYPSKKISEVAETTSGGTPLRNNQEYYGGTIPWLKSGELNDGLIDHAEEYITEQGLKNSSAKVFPSGTLLLAMYGATVGKTGITSIDTATNQAVCAIFPKDAIRRDYLYWFFKQHRYKYIEQSKGGAQPNISQSVINQTSVPLPELEIQDKLVSILQKIQNNNILDLTEIPSEYRTNINKVFNTKSTASKIEEEIESQQRNVKLLRQQILQDAIQGKLVPQDPNDEPASKLLERIKAEKELLVKEKKIKKEKPLPPIKPEEIPFEIPEGWVWCRLGAVIELVSGQDLTPNLYSDKENSGLPYITGASNLQEGRVLINRWTKTPKSFAFTGDLLLTCKGAGVGKMAFLQEKSVHIARQIMALRSTFASIEYISKVMETNVVNYQSKAKSLIPGIDRGIVFNTLLPLPPISEQHRIVEKIKNLMQYCNELEQTIQQNQKYTQELLQVALKEALTPET